MAMAMDWYGEQIELFPKATKSELKIAKAALSRYRRMKSVVNDFETKGIDSLAPKQAGYYNAYKVSVGIIERAVNLIQDVDVKRIIDVRYIKGQPHHVTVARFEFWHPSTVDRKINRGIESVANTIKLWEI